MPNSRELQAATDKDMKEYDRHVSKVGAELSGLASSLWSAEVHAFQRDWAATKEGVGAAAKWAGDAADASHKFAVGAYDATAKAVGGAVDATGKAIGGAVDATGKAGAAVGNELYKENKEYIQGAQKMADTAGRKVVDHYKERPLTAGIETLLPPLALADALSRPEKKAAHVEVHKPITNESQVKPQNVKPSDSSTSETQSISESAHHHKVKSGETYWSIAKDTLKEEHKSTTNKDVAALVAQMVAKNGGKEQLLPNVEIVI